MKPPDETGSRKGLAEEEKGLLDIAEKTKGLFSGELTGADVFGYVITMEGKLLENKLLREQAATNSEEQSLGEFKDVFSGTAIDCLAPHSSIAKQLRADDRIFAEMQATMASAVCQASQAFQANRAGGMI